MAQEPFFRHVRRQTAGVIAEFASESWVVQAERCRMAVERALPDASVELCFNLGPAGRHISTARPRPVLPHRAAWVVGPRGRPLDIEKETRDCDIVAIRLFPWTAQRVLGAPASEVRESMVDLELFWGSSVAETRDRLSQASDPDERLRIVEAAVLHQAARRRDGIDARRLRQLCQDAAQDGSVSIGRLAARHGLTHRRVIDIFDATVGLKPKEFHRVTRLRRVFRLVDAVPRPTWTSIAHRCGYYD